MIDIAFRPIKFLWTPKQTRGHGKLGNFSIFIKFAIFVGSLYSKVAKIALNKKNRAVSKLLGLILVDAKYFYGPESKGFMETAFFI